MTRFIIPLLVFCLSLQVFSAPTEAYEEETHQLITQLAVRASTAQDTISLLPPGTSLLLDDRLLGRSIVQWAELGADREDALPRPLNHFHNPLTAWTVAGLGIGQSSALWLQNQDQAWSWSRIRDHFYDSLTRATPSERDRALTKVFRGLGHLVHLVQDAASPAHTRNDPHPFGYQYEKLILDIQQVEPDFVDQYLPTPVGPDSDWRQLPSNTFGPLPAALLIDGDQYLATDAHTGLNPGVTSTSLVGLAEYTNANFLSEDTLWGNRLGRFKYPAPTSTGEIDREIRLSSGEVVTRRYHQKVADGDTGHLLATVGLLRHYYVRYNLDPARANDTAGLDEMVYRDYARKLLPRALGYSIAMINEFFNGFRERQFVMRLARSVDGVSGPDRIVFHAPLLSSEVMEGRFELYSQGAGGRHDPVASWSLTLSPGVYSAALLTPLLPYDPNLTCLAVFRGRAGQEPDVVRRSTEAACPMADPPPPPPPICIPFCD